MVDKDGQRIGILFTGGVAFDESGYPASWMSPAETIIRDIEAHGLGAGWASPYFKARADAPEPWQREGRRRRVIWRGGTMP